MYAEAATKTRPAGVDNPTGQRSDR
jgi:hypothetical protein